MARVETVTGFDVEAEGENRTDDAQMAFPFVEVAGGEGGEAPAPAAVATTGGTAAADVPADITVEANAVDGPPRDERAALLARLREALAAAEPGLDPALLPGETLEELEASYAAARAAVARIREALRREEAAIPAGAPGRQDTAPATAIEKIRAGLAKR